MHKFLLFQADGLFHLYNAVRFFYYEYSRTEVVFIIERLHNKRTQLNTDPIINLGLYDLLITKNFHNKHT